MANITKRDVQIFGRVLKAIGEAVESNPEMILTVIEMKHESEKPAIRIETSSSFSEKVQNADLYTYVKEHNGNELAEYLRSFSADELKELIKKYNFGYTKLKAVDSIADYIADQLKKRTTDVFMQHEK